MGSIAFGQTSVHSSMYCGNKLNTIHNLNEFLTYSSERFSKSQRFKAKLEKVYQQNRLDCFVIDEAHCCSEVGSFIA